MLRNLVLAVAMLLVVAGGARAESRLFTLTDSGPVRTAQAEPQNTGQTIFGIDTMTVATVTIGAMFGAVAATEVAVIGLGVYGYPAATLWVAGVSSFVAGGVGGGVLANWILETSRAPRTSPLDRSNGAAQANVRR